MPVGYARRSIGGAGCAGHFERRWKPSGTMGCEIRRKIGSMPAGIDDMDLYGTVTKTELTIEYPMEQIGETVYYAFRWVHKSGATSDWSDTTPATVAA